MILIKSLRKSVKFINKVMRKLLSMKCSLILMGIVVLALVSLSLPANPLFEKRTLEENADTGTSTEPAETSNDANTETSTAPTETATDSSNANTENTASTDKPAETENTTNATTDNTAPTEDAPKTEAASKTDSVPIQDEKFPEGEKYDELDDPYDQESFDEYLNDIFVPLPEDKPKEPEPQPEEPPKEPEGPTPEELKEQYENEDTEEDISMPDPQPEPEIEKPTNGEGEGSDEEEGAEPVTPVAGPESFSADDDVPENTVTEDEPKPQIPPKTTFNDLLASFNLVMPAVDSNMENSDMTINEIIMNLSQDYFDVKLPGKEDFSRILRVINDSDKLKKSKVNLSPMKHMHALHLQSIMNCMLVSDCQMERMVRALKSKIRQENEMYRQLADKHFEGEEAESAKQEESSSPGIMSMIIGWVTTKAKDMIANRGKSDEGAPSRVLTFQKFHQRHLNGMNRQSADKHFEGEEAEPAKQEESSSPGIMSMIIGWVTTKAKDMITGGGKSEEGAPSRVLMNQNTHQKHLNRSFGNSFVNGSNSIGTKRQLNENTSKDGAQPEEQPSVWTRFKSWFSGLWGSGRKNSQNNGKDKSRRLDEKAPESAAQKTPEKAPEAEEKPSIWTRFKSWVSCLFGCKEESKSRRLGSSDESEESPGWSQRFVTWVKSLFNKEDSGARRILVETIEDDPLEILISRISEDYGGLVKKLDYGFTNDQVKSVTGEYLDFLKDELLDVETEQTGWIEDVTSELDDLRENLNQDDITVDNFDGYMERLRSSWKAKADEEVNLETASKLTTLAGTIDDYKKKLNEKVPQSNALNPKIQDFLDTYKKKVVEVADFLEKDPKNVDKLKDELKDSVDKIVDDNKQYGKDKEEDAVKALNKVKSTLNTTLFKSLNKDNLKYILNSVVSKGIEDIDSMKDPNKESNFVLDRDDMKDFSLRVINMLKDMTNNEEKISWNVRTKEAQKLLDGGKELVEASSSDDKVIDLEQMEDKLASLNKAAGVAIGSEEVQTKLADLVNDTVNYQKLNQNFDLSGVKNTELYSFLTKDINETELSTPSRILHSLNKMQLANSANLSTADNDTFRFIRRLLQRWNDLSDRPADARRMLKETFRVMTGTSTRNLKLTHKFDLSAAVGKFKEIYGQLTGQVDTGITTSKKLTGTVDEGRNKLTSITKHFNISTLVGTEKSGFSKFFSFLPWVEKDPESRRVLFDLTSFKTMKDELQAAHQNAKKITQEVEDARGFTKKFEEGFAILKQFA